MPSYRYILVSSTMPSGKWKDGSLKHFLKKSPQLVGTGVKEWTIRIDWKMSLEQNFGIVREIYQ